MASTWFAMSAALDRSEASRFSRQRLKLRAGANQERPSRPDDEDPPWFIHPAAHYSRLSITLHWLMLVLLAAVYACIELRGLFPKGSAERDVMKDLHFMLGLSVFVLVWLRLALRLSRRHPSDRAQATGLADRLSHLVHLLLYLMMIGLPLAGWADPQRRRQADPLLWPGAAGHRRAGPGPGQVHQRLA
jgi:hypothetical protein